MEITSIIQGKFEDLDTAESYSTNGGCPKYITLKAAAGIVSFAYGAGYAVGAFIANVANVFRR